MLVLSCGLLYPQENDFIVESRIEQGQYIISESYVCVDVISLDVDRLVLGGVVLAYNKYLKNISALEYLEMSCERVGILSNHLRKVVNDE